MTVATVGGGSVLSLNPALAGAVSSDRLSAEFADISRRCRAGKFRNDGGGGGSVLSGRKAFAARFCEDSRSRIARTAALFSAMAMSNGVRPWLSWASICAPSVNNLSASREAFRDAA